MEEPRILSSNTRGSSRSDKRVYKEPRLSAEHGACLVAVDTGQEAWLLTLGRDRSRVGLMEDVTSETPLRNGKNESRPHKEGHWLSRERTKHKHLHRTSPNTCDPGSGKDRMCDGRGRVGLHKNNS